MNYSFDEYTNAQRIITKYSFRAMEVCKIFKDQMFFSGVNSKHKIWDRISELDIPDIFFIDNFNICATFPLDYIVENNGDEARVYLEIRFPTQLMNTSNNEIAKYFYIDCIGDFKTRYIFEIDEKVADAIETSEG